MMAIIARPPNIPARIGATSNIEIGMVNGFVAGTESGLVLGFEGFVEPGPISWFVAP